MHEFMSALYVCTLHGTPRARISLSSRSARSSWPAWPALLIAVV
jgi:hypothetical protein